MTRALETTQSELTTLRKEVVAQRELLNSRKSRKSGKRIALKGRFVFSTQEVLEVVQQAEAETAAKKTRKRKRERSNSIEREEQEDSISQNHSSDSEGDCIIVAASRSIQDVEE